MANYPLTQSGDEVQALLDKVQSPDATPTTSSQNLVTSGGVKAALDQKVDKVSGKGLSTNDYTDAEKQKLNGIASGAQANVVEGVQVNGSDLPVSGKKVNVIVPTKTSDINNDSGFITKDVGNLTNYKDNDALNELLEQKASVSDLEVGAVVPKLAENLESWAEEDGLEVTNEWDETIRTTAGDDPIVTESGGILMGIQAVSDFKCASLKTTPYNQLRLASNGGGAVAIGTGWYFPVPKLVFGAYGSAEENNGILLTARDKSNIKNAAVRFKALSAGVPTSVSDGSECSYVEDHGLRFYVTPGEGWLIVSGITYADTCAHIAWEDWYDKFVDPADPDDVGDTVNVAPVFAAAPNGTGKFLVCGGAATRAERIDETHMRITDPVARLTSPAWTTVSSEGGYTHTLNIPAMKPGGDVLIEGSSQALTVDGTTVSYTDENATAISGAVRYELLAPATATATLAKTSYVLNDCGIEMKDGAEGSALFTCAYSQNVADALSQIAKIRVGDIVDDVAAIQDEMDRSVYETPFEADFGLMPSLGGQPGVLFCEGAPTAANKPLNWVDFMDGGYEWTGLPSVIGQHVRDITNGKDYWGYRNPSTELMEWK